MREFCFLNGFSDVLRVFLCFLASPHATSMIINVTAGMHFPETDDMKIYRKQSHTWGEVCFSKKRGFLMFP
jgi:hypothetical protein